jgi:hypothetical protein
MLLRELLKKFIELSTGKVEARAAGFVLTEGGRVHSPTLLWTEKETSDAKAEPPMRKQGSIVVSAHRWTDTEVNSPVAPRQSAFVMFLSRGLSANDKDRRFGIGGRICGEAASEVDEITIDDTVDKLVMGDMLVMNGKPDMSTVWSCGNAEKKLSGKGFPVRGLPANNLLRERMFNLGAPRNPGLICVMKLFSSRIGVVLGEKKLPVLLSAPSRSSSRLLAEWK